MVTSACSLLKKASIDSSHTAGPAWQHTNASTRPLAQHQELEHGQQPAVPIRSAWLQFDVCVKLFDNEQRGENHAQDSVGHSDSSHASIETCNT